MKHCPVLCSFHFCCCLTVQLVSLLSFVSVRFTPFGAFFGVILMKHVQISCVCFNVIHWMPKWWCLCDCCFLCIYSAQTKSLANLKSLCTNFYLTTLFMVKINPDKLHLEVFTLCDLKKHINIVLTLIFFLTSAWLIYSILFLN